MIAVKPDNDAGRVLAALVAAPGELDAEAIGAQLWPAPASPPPPLQFSPGAASTAYRSWLASVSGQRQTQALHRSRAAAKASRLLGRLQEAGLVEKQRPPALSVWWRGWVAESSIEAAFERILLAMEYDQVEGDEEELHALSYLQVQAEGTRVLELIAQVGKGPRSTQEVLGHEPDGTTKRAWARLIELGIVVPASYRWPTQRGVDLVASWTWGER